MTGRHVVGIALAAGALASDHRRGDLLVDVVGKLRAKRHRELGEGPRGRYVGDGDVVILLVDQGAGTDVLKRSLEALGVKA